MKLYLPLTRDFPYLLIQKGKYGDFYYHIDNEETFQAALLSIFNTQKDNGYYRYFDTKEDLISKIHALRLDIDLLKKAIESKDLTKSLRYAAEKELDSKSKDLKNWLQEFEDSKIYQKIIDGDHSLIYKFLINRLDYEYERIETETYSNETPSSNI